MTRDEAEKLLGGYATGTLTAEERGALFAAALTDQTLFDTLADEEALKALLENPAARRDLLQRLRAGRPAPGPLGRLRAWFSGYDLVPPSRRRTVWAAAGGVAVLILAVTAVTRLYREAALPPPPPLAQPETRERRQDDTKAETTRPAPAPMTQPPAVLKQRKMTAPTVPAQAEHNVANDEPQPAKPVEPIAVAWAVAEGSPTGAARDRYYDASNATSGFAKSSAERRSESKTDAPREPAAAARPQTPALEESEAKAIRQLAVPLAVRITTTTEGGQRQLLVEANQPAYLTAVLTAADGRRQPQIPEAGSLRLIPHGSTAIPLPAGVPGDRLRVSVSTMPPVTDALEKSKAASIVTERLQEARPDGSEETVTYVTAADPSAPELHIDFIAR